MGLVLRGEKKTEGQKRRVRCKGPSFFFFLLSRGRSAKVIVGAMSKASALINPLADLGSKAAAFGFDWCSSPSGSQHMGEYISSRTCCSMLLALEMSRGEADARESVRASRASRWEPLSGGCAVGDVFYQKLFSVTSPSLRRKPSLVRGPIPWSQCSAARRPCKIRSGARLKSSEVQKHV